MGQNGDHFVKCICEQYSDAGDTAPRLWRCSEHGNTGMVGLSATYDEFRQWMSWDEFWDVTMGTLQLQRALHRSLGKIYYCDERLYRDVKSHIQRTMETT